jgi:hypothetical protein
MSTCAGRFVLAVPLGGVNAPAELALASLTAIGRRGLLRRSSASSESVDVDAATAPRIATSPTRGSGALFGTQPRQRNRWTPRPSADDVEGGFEDIVRRDDIARVERRPHRRRRGQEAEDDVDA